MVPEGGGLDMRVTYVDDDGEESRIRGGERYRKFWILFYLKTLIYTTIILNNDQ